MILVKNNFSHILKIHISLILCLFFYISIDAIPIGELVYSDNITNIWWAGSTYKIMQDNPIPKSSGRIIVRSAKNETESFQLIISPSIKLKDISVTVSDFKKKEGESISSNNVIVRNVEYVNVTKPTGKLHKAGWYPDPLPLCDKPFNASEDINTPLWITVKVPDDAVAGIYYSNILLKSSNWETLIPVELYVWNFTLPQTPFMRSGFGLYTDLIKKYHNLESTEELDIVKNKYYQNFKDYKISPYGSYNVKYKTNGISWSGGTFDPHNVYDGRYSYQITGQHEGKYIELIEINPKNPYMLKWKAKTDKENQKYTVIVKCYDVNKNPIHWSMKWIVYEGSQEWRQDTLFIDNKDFFTFEDLPDYRPFPEHTKYASLHLYPYHYGTNCLFGTVWFDNFQFIDLISEKNLLSDGNFEQDINKLDMELDFSEFDTAARKYLDKMGFTGFRTSFTGLQSGPYVGEKVSWFNGFINGTPEYEKLVGLYFKGFQDHLEANGWLGKEYFYWVDEPRHEEYDFVREGMQTIRKNAPKLTRFITENNPGPEIMDVTEIGCPVFYKVDPDKVKNWSDKGREFWSYLMCWPKEPHVNLFIDSDAINMRMWIWMSYKYNLTGILVWQTNHWNGSNGAASEGLLQNIWEDPMTYKSGYGTPYGSSPEFGNGDGMFFYPPNRDPNNDKNKYLNDPVPSLRLEILREGLDDYDYMRMLENCIKTAHSNQKSLITKAEKILNFGTEIFINDKEYTKDPTILMKYRKQMGDLLEKFYEDKSTDKRNN